MVFAAIAKAIFGSANDRQIKKYQPKVDAINALEPQMAKLSDAELEELFDLGYHLKRVDQIFERVFGAA